MSEDAHTLDPSKKFFWKCGFAGCQEELSAFMESTLELLKGFHMDKHHRDWVKNGPAGLLPKAYDVLELTDEDRDFLAKAKVSAN